MQINDAYDRCVGSIDNVRLPFFIHISSMARSGKTTLLQNLLEHVISSQRIFIEKLKNLYKDNDITINKADIPIIIPIYRNGSSMKSPEHFRDLIFDLFRVATERYKTSNGRVSTLILLDNCEICSQYLCEIAEYYNRLDFINYGQSSEIIPELYGIMNPHKAAVAKKDCDEIINIDENVESNCHKKQTRSIKEELLARVRAPIQIIATSLPLVDESSQEFLTAVGVDHFYIAKGYKKCDTIADISIKSYVAYAKNYYATAGLGPQKLQEISVVSALDTNDLDKMIKHENIINNDDELGDIDYNANTHILRAEKEGHNLCINSNLISFAHLSVLERLLLVVCYICSRTNPKDDCWRFGVASVGKMVTKQQFINRHVKKTKRTNMTLDSARNCSSDQTFEEFLSGGVLNPPRKSFQDATAMNVRTDAHVIPVRYDRLTISTNIMLSNMKRTSKLYETIGTSSNNYLTEEADIAPAVSALLRKKMFLRTGTKTSRYMPLQNGSFRCNVDLRELVSIAASIGIDVEVLLTQ